MIGGRQARGVGIPVQQIERERRLALQVVVDDVGPDQVVRAQHIEDGRHRLDFEIAALGHSLFERRDLLLVDEDLEIAGIGEVDLGGEQGRRHDALVVPGRHGRERDRQQRAADAIADGVNLVLAGRLLDRVERRERSFADVILEALSARDGRRD